MVSKNLLSPKAKLISLLIILETAFEIFILFSNSASYTGIAMVILRNILLILTITFFSKMYDSYKSSSENKGFLSWIFQLDKEFLRKGSIIGVLIIAETFIEMFAFGQEAIFPNLIIMLLRNLLLFVLLFSAMFYSNHTK